ncbi:hypothetical protein [Alteromonas lipolytica]|uniref:Riboflavin biosynthesis protein RibA n=1 Tax=Alteromonas lipolytica TaxID=1856405 RepID=A0A1E8FDL2_9ALTE|nr:hypothetical protein [Alteromonas lipolytica]OFI34025.1 hypothetical protein BFC17_20960 [Alteromonas lipolytica]GGF66111.1 hypothetical protein GCM10011338_18060 [Alteromonas lipolytica]
MSDSTPNFRTTFIPAENVQIASVYETERSARQAIKHVVDSSSIDAEQVTLIEPGDSEFNRKLEGDSKALGKMMWFSHLLLGAAGLAVGLITAYLLVSIGPALTQQNPTFTYIALISPGIFIGLFVAGLLSLRPDRTQIIEVVRQALKAQHYAVVVNLREGQSVAKIRDLFGHHSNKVVESIQ